MDCLQTSRHWPHRTSVFATTIIAEPATKHNKLNACSKSLLCLLPPLATGHSDNHGGRLLLWKIQPLNGKSPTWHQSAL